jgi:alpha-beta hydrolase superfamily lysophospholipase
MQSNSLFDNTLFQYLPLLTLLYLLAGCSGSDLPPSHSVQLTEEFSLQRGSEIDSFQKYLQLEQQLFTQLDKEVYAATDPARANSVARYSSGSLADPRGHRPDWNRSFELDADNARGGILLLHGMSDSPYSLRALGQGLNKNGYQVLGLRLPGHGTAPSGMTTVTWQDMAAAMDLAMQHLTQQLGDRPVHIIGYSTGAGLALDYALRAEQDSQLTPPGSLVLVSPAIGISQAAALAQWKHWLSLLPGLGNLAWLQVEPEFDPYKYNSFATNAAEQVHLLTHSVSQRIEHRRSQSGLLPPILVLKSTVDATVSTDAVVDRLLSKLSPGRHELVLFDINRVATSTSLIIDDPAPFTRRLIDDGKLPFGVTLVTNSGIDTRAVSAFHKKPFESGASSTEGLDAVWPMGVFSLSHVALPFPSDDPLYGSSPPEESGHLFLGSQALQGERGLLKISGDYLLRLRHNPFYDYLERRTLAWINRKLSSPRTPAQ